MNEENNTLRLKDLMEIRIPSQERDKLDAAFERVYQRYGNDLPAFFRDAYSEVARQATEKCVRRDSEK